MLQERRGDLELTKETLAVIGGTGNIGLGLALRWADAGYDVIVGSRSDERAEQAAADINTKLTKGAVRGMANEKAAQAADVVVMTVPFSAQAGTLAQVHEGCQGKIVVDVTVPLVPPKVNRVQLPPEDSAALITQAALGENVRVVSAFQNVGADHLQHLGQDIDCDVLVCGDNKDAREVVVRLAGAAGLRGVHAGSLANSVASEALTSVLIWLNQRHKVTGSGIRITGIPSD
ncbi:MAG: NADPH-dependent F420 reductase [Gammaproteobacteria bacterium]